MLNTMAFMTFPYPRICSVLSHSLTCKTLEPRESHISRSTEAAKATFIFSDPIGRLNSPTGPCGPQTQVGATNIVALGKLRHLFFLETSPFILFHRIESHGFLFILPPATPNTPSPPSMGYGTVHRLPTHIPTTMSTSQLTRTEEVGLLAIGAGCATVYFNTFRGDGQPLTASLALSGFAFALTYAMILWLGPSFMKAGLKGTDMSKIQRREIPECAGAICAVVCLMALFVFIPSAFYKDIVAATSGGGNRDVVLQAEFVQKGRFLHIFPHSKVSTA